MQLKPYKKALVCLFATALVILSTSNLAYAGLFSVFGADAETTPVAHNSQTIPLPEAVVPIDPSTSLDDSIDSNIVDGQALSADSIYSGDLSQQDAPSADQITIYSVHKGDTIASVAKMFNLSQKTIIYVNGLKPGQSLNEGDALVILPTNGIKHIVKKGDTLAKIAKTYNADIEDIKQFNSLEDDSDLIIGDEVIVPNGVLPNSTPNKTNPKQKPGISVKHARMGKFASLPTLADFFVNPVAGAPITQWIHDNNAIDFGVHKGTQVASAADGKVVVANYKPGRAWFGGFGNFIVIVHETPLGTVHTLYAHLSKVSVRVGETVQAGEIIGASGNTGRSTGPHLHFETWEVQNPAATGSWKS